MLGISSVEYHKWPREHLNHHAEIEVVTIEIEPNVEIKLGFEGFHSGLNRAMQLKRCGNHSSSLSGLNSLIAALKCLHYALAN